MTLDDDDIEEKVDTPIVTSAKKNVKAKNVIAMNPGFTFNFESTPVKPWEFSSIRSFMHPLGAHQTSLDYKIQMKKEERGAQSSDRATSATAAGDSSSKENTRNKRSKPNPKEEEEDVAEEMVSTSTSASLSSLPPDTLRPLINNDKFFEHAPVNTTVCAFTDLSLDRRLQRAITELGYTVPTPVQASVIPVALMGRDVCANAITGSGKTAAFMLPVLHRLLTGRGGGGIRCLVLTPTRELAAQCMSMTQALARNTTLKVCLVVGGLSESKQLVELRRNPDVVVATPGRLIDHLRNSQSVHITDLQVLILDEADRLLEQGFMGEIQQVLTFVPKTRQTLLFSATMTTSIEQLVGLALQSPVRVAVSAMFQLSDHLTQEFVRIRKLREHDKEAMLLHVCSKVFKTKTIVFFKQKKQAHRMKIMFGLLGLSASELHSNMTQSGRLDSLELFRDNKSDFLLATDLASRGLDILGVQTVINFDMPSSMTQYIHRVGRTARAGKAGRSLSFIEEGSERVMLKELLKTARTKCLSRSIAVDSVAAWREKIEALESDIRDIWKDEYTEKVIRLAEMESNKATNLLEHEVEIHHRPKKTWFQSQDDKARARTLGGPNEAPPLPEVDEAALKKKKAEKMDPRNMTNKERKKLALKKERAEMMSEMRKQRSGKTGKQHHSASGGEESATALGVRQQLQAAAVYEQNKKKAMEKSGGGVKKAGTTKTPPRLNLDEFGNDVGGRKSKRGRDGESKEDKEKHSAPRGPKFKSKARYKRRS